MSRIVRGMCQIKLSSVDSKIYMIRLWINEINRTLCDRLNNPSHRKILYDLLIESLTELALKFSYDDITDIHFGDFTNKLKNYVHIKDNFETLA